MGINFCYYCRILILLKLDEILYLDVILYLEAIIIKQANLMQKQQTKKPEKIEAQKLIGQVTHTYQGIISDKESIFYSLSIGLSQDPMKQEDFKYTSQVNEEFVAFPTVGSVAHHTDFITPLLKSPNMPKFSPHIILHAEQKFTMIKDKIDLGIQYYHECKVTDCIDKGQNAIVCYQVNSYQIVDGKKQLAYVCDQSLFMKGLGGFGFKGKGFFKSLPPIPQRDPDMVKNAKTFPNQSFLYRLTGDRNPLHIDPKFSAKAKFEKPIIHGMATYGTVAKVFVQQVLNNDPTKFKSYHTKFIGHVYPGQELTLNLWKQGENTYLFEATTNVRKTKVLVGAFETKPGAKL